MWKSRGKIYMCNDTAHVITKVGCFKFIDTDDKINKYYHINKINNDQIYKELFAYYCLLDGRDFIPVAFKDTCKKLSSLPENDDDHIKMHWCVAYVSPYLIDRNKATIRMSKREIKSPSYMTLLNWFKYHVNSYDNSVDSHINQVLSTECLRQFIIENKPASISSMRFFKLIYNNAVIFNKSGKCSDWINHLENLVKRDIYEIVVNEFE